MSEAILKVGRKGEIFTTKELREKAKIREGGKIQATVVGNRLIIEAILSIEDMLRNPVVSLQSREAERLSEAAQKEEEIYG